MTSSGTPSPEETAGFLEATRDGWCAANGVHFLRASRDEVVAELAIDDRHLQAYGIVHGGVHCGLIETLASVGAALDAMAGGKRVVGLENHTSFIKAARSGTLIGTARPLTRGRRSQVWEVSVVGDDGRLVATGRVRVLCLEPDAELVVAKSD